MEDFIMYEKYLEQLEEAGKIRNLKERSINCYKNYVSHFLKYQAKPPEELTCQDVRNFLLAKKEEGLKAITLNLYNSSIRFFYRNVLHILWDDITVPRMILEPYRISSCVFTLHTLKNIPLLQNRQRFPETS